MNFIEVSSDYLQQLSELFKALSLRDPQLFLLFLEKFHHLHGLAPHNVCGTCD